MKKYIIILPIILFSSITIAKIPSSSVFVQLFGWHWNDVAKECETFLGPKGYSAVQISPAQEHVQGNTWWKRYQPVSYKLNSNGGTEQQFKDMASRCRNVGVQVFADMVHNHMTAYEGNFVGTSGTRFSKHYYEGLYSREDFKSGCALHNYTNRWDIQNCDVVSLADLNTGKESVQQKIADYYNKLQSMGVTGFRIDAAKHISSEDIKNILSKVDRSNDPFIFQEVIDWGGGPIKAREYYGNGYVTEFVYGSALKKLFDDKKLFKVKDMKVWGELMPSKSAVVFIDNHDNQRGVNGKIYVPTFKNKKQYLLANIIMLATPYGQARVMSSYNFEGHSDPAPQRPVHGSNGELNCNRQNWICEHRFPAIVNMVNFRKVTKDASSVTHWWSNNGNAIAFGRGALGFVVVNGEQRSLKATMKTALPLGTYCDIVSGELSSDGKSCSGKELIINSDGKLNVSLKSMEAVVVHIDSKKK